MLGGYFFGSRSCSATAESGRFGGVTRTTLLPVFLIVVATPPPGCGRAVITSPNSPRGFFSSAIQAPPSDERGHTTTVHGDEQARPAVRRRFSQVCWSCHGA